MGHILHKKLLKLKPSFFEMSCYGLHCRFVFGLPTPQTGRSEAH